MKNFILQYLFYGSLEGRFQLLLLGLALILRPTTVRPLRWDFKLILWSRPMISLCFQTRYLISWERHEAGISLKALLSKWKACLTRQIKHVHDFYALDDFHVISSQLNRHLPVFIKVILLWFDYKLVLNL